MVPVLVQAGNMGFGFLPFFPDPDGVKELNTKSVTALLTVKRFQQLLNVCSDVSRTASGMSTVAGSLLASDGHEVRRVMDPLHLHLCMLGSL